MFDVFPDVVIEDVASGGASPTVSAGDIAVNEEIGTAEIKFSRWPRY